MQNVRNNFGLSSPVRSNFPGPDFFLNQQINKYFKIPTTFYMCLHQKYKNITCIPSTKIYYCFKTKRSLKINITVRYLLFLSILAIRVDCTISFVSKNRVFLHWRQLLIAYAIRFFCRTAVRMLVFQFWTGPDRWKAGPLPTLVATIAAASSWTGRFHWFYEES